MKTYLSNAFSLQMLDMSAAHEIHAAPVTAEETAQALSGGFTSAIGHADTARVVSGMLGLDVPANRANIRLTAADALYVAQVTGGRLLEGATELPKGMTLAFVRVTAD